MRKQSRHLASAHQPHAINQNERQRQIYLLAGLMCFSALAFFTFMPYLALYLHGQFGLSNTAAGLAVGSITLVSSCGAWLGGALADRIGWLGSLRGAALLYSLILAGLAFSTQLILVLALVTGIGLARMLLEPALKSALASYDDGSGRMFKLRYLSISLGAIAGPLLAGVLAQFGARSGFMLASAFFALYCLFTIGLQTQQTSQSLGQQALQGQGAAASEKIQWPPIISLIAFGLAFFLAFSQIDSTLSLSLNARFGANGVDIYRTTLLLNALLAIPMMLVSDKIFAKWSLRAQVLLGVVALTLGTLLWFYRFSDPLALYIGAFFFTLGEVILYPLPEIAAAKLAGEGQRGRILGLIDLRYLGFFFGPALGGLMLDHAPSLLAWLMCGLCLTIFPLFLWSQRLAARVEKGTTK